MSSVHPDSKTKVVYCTRRDILVDVSPRAYVEFKIIVDLEPCCDSFIGCGAGDLRVHRHIQYVFNLDSARIPAPLWLNKNQPGLTIAVVCAIEIDGLITRFGFKHSSPF